MIATESSGNPRADSGDAQGLMQLTPATARSLGVSNAFDPAQNIEGGVKYLAQLFAQFKSWPLAIAAYNAGPGNVAKYGLAALNVSGADPQYLSKVLGTR